jgi:hypothetical protein
VVWHLPGGEQLLEVVSPRWRRARHLGVVPHESYYLDPIDVTLVDGIMPVTKPARTILDLCGLAARGLMAFETVELALQEAVRRNLVDIEFLAARLERLGPMIRVGAREAERLIDRWLPNAAMTDSRAENLVLRMLSDAGFPDPTPQHRIWLSPHEFVAIDFAWPDLKVGLEFDSYRYHGGRLKHNADARRELRIRDQGWELVPITDDELDAGCLLAFSVLAKALSAAA